MSDTENIELDYAFLAQSAMRGVVRDVLEITQTLGHPPGEHHFYIEFLTGAPGVQIGPNLKAQYPERMTIVLQHQFEALDVHQDRFEVTLHFKGVPDRLIIPFAALTQFADPSVNFALQFPAEGGPALPSDQDPRPEAEIEPLDAHRPQAENHDAEDDDDPEGDGPSGGSADIVSLDRFRKK